jgi:hypothetical protein
LVVLLLPTCKEIPVRLESNVALAEGNVNVVESVPLNVRVLLTVNVLPEATANPAMSPTAESVVNIGAVAIPEAPVERRNQLAVVVFPDANTVVPAADW